MMTKQLQEMSFYCFLQQFFYNDRNLFLREQDGLSKKCQHMFHQSCKMIFLIDIMRIEF